MHKIIKTATVTLLAGMLIISSAGCASSTASTSKKAITIQREVAVQKGSMSTTVSVDGNLVMPEAYNLNFGSTGEVKNVYVKEGDVVKAGTILATLDDASQKLDIQSSNNNVQTTLSNLYETVPRLPQFPGNYYLNSSGAPNYTFDFVPDKIVYDKDSHAIMATELGITITPVYPGYYPNATSLSSFNWAGDEIVNSFSYSLVENCTAASSELSIALADLEATAVIIEDAINNPESGLGNTAPAINDENEMYFLLQQDQSFAGYYVQTLRRLVQDIRNAESDIIGIKDLITQKKYSEAAPLYEALFTKINNLGKAIITNYNVIEVRNDTKVYGKDICQYLFNEAEIRLGLALDSIKNEGVKSQSVSDNISIARHYAELCNAIIGTNDYVLQHGLSLKAEQQYKIELQQKLINLDTSKNNYLSTYLWARFDGEVVSVGIKEKDVLSSKDFTSKTIQLVDTSKVKFTGTVDEIDITTIQKGQKAIISVDAVSDKKFPGKVVFISPSVSTDTSTSTSSVKKFDIIIELEPFDVALKGKLTSSADIEIKTIDDALMLPISAVTTDKDGSYVNMKNSTTGQVEKKKVTTGIQNTQYIQIVSGLNEGDKVIVEDKATGAPVSTTMGPPGGGGGGGPPPGR